VWVDVWGVGWEGRGVSRRIGVITSIWEARAEIECKSKVAKRVPRRWPPEVRTWGGEGAESEAGRWFQRICLHLP
jgi:hypothetical protein